jgi:hypothetical protein
MSIFEPLAAVSKFMEGENYTLVSSYFSALRKIEDIMQPQAGDSPEVAQIRATMYNDHFSSRVTLDQAVKSPLCVMGTLLDPRYVCFDRFAQWQIFIPSSLLLSIFYLSDGA